MKLPQALQNTADLPDTQPFDLVPAGKYRMVVDSSEVKDSNAGDLVLLKMKLQIIEDGPMQGRVLFDQMVIEANRSSPAYQRLPETGKPSKQSKETAVAIGQGKFKSLSDACGLAQVTDSDQLCGRPVIGDVRIIKSKNPEYPDDKNEIRGYRAAASTPPPAVAAPQGQGYPGHPPAATTGPAW